MAQTKISTVQWPMAYTTILDYTAIPAGNEYVIDIPPGSIIMNGFTKTLVAFNGTTPTVTIQDNAGTPNVFVNAAAIATLDGVNQFAAGELGNYYPAGAKITIDLAGTGVTAGQLAVVMTLVVMGRQNERVGAYSAT